MYIMFLMFTVALLIIDWPKEYNKKTILTLVIKAFITYFAYVIFESLVFAFVYGLSAQIDLGVLFSGSFAIIPVAYICIFSKGKPIHKIVKIEMVIASFLAVSQISKNLSFTFDVRPDEFNGWVQHPKINMPPSFLNLHLPYNTSHLVS